MDTVYRSEPRIARVITTEGLETDDAKKYAMDLQQLIQKQLDAGLDLVGLIPHVGKHAVYCEPDPAWSRPGEDTNTYYPYGALIFVGPKPHEEIDPYEQVRKTNATP